MSSVLSNEKLRSALCGRPSTLPSSRFNILKGSYSFSLHEFIADIRQEWDEMVVDEEFAKSDYLQTLEETNDKSIANLYLKIYDRRGNHIGVVLLQRLILDISESFRYEKYSTDRSRAARWIQRFRQAFMSLFKFRMLVVGNMYLTGQYGIFFKDPHISLPESFRIVDQILVKARRELCSSPFRFQGILYKDYFENQKPSGSVRKKFKEFRIDPNMILNINPSWTVFDDYLLDMRSKYRIRMRNGMRKFRKIERRELSTSDVHQLYRKMYVLYDELLGHSGFVLAKGSENYFLNLKERLGDRLVVKGFFLDNELVGFYTWVKEREKLDSHFIGFNGKLNLRYQLYLNILLDLVGDSIQVKVKQLYLFRTALEIKSSIGAVPHEMYCYFRHGNTIINKLFIKPFFGYFVPKQHWTQRHPFKTDDSGELA